MNNCGVCGKKAKWKGFFNTGFLVVTCDEHKEKTANHFNKEKGITINWKKIGD